MSLPFIRFQISAMKLELLILAVLLTAVALLQRDPMTTAPAVNYEDQTTQFLLYVLVPLGLLLPVRIFWQLAWRRSMADFPRTDSTPTVCISTGIRTNCRGTFLCLGRTTTGIGAPDCSFNSRSGLRGFQWCDGTK